MTNSVVWQSETETHTKQFPAFNRLPPVTVAATEEKKQTFFSLSLFFPLFLLFFSCWALQKTSVNNVCQKKNKKKAFDVSQKSKTWKCPICSMHGKLQLFHQISTWTFVPVILRDFSSFAPPALSTVPAFFMAELENSYSFLLNFFVLHLCLPWIRTKH